jgi:hypothetical protein
MRSQVPQRPGEGDTRALCVRNGTLRTLKVVICQWYHKINPTKGREKVPLAHE